MAMKRLELRVPEDDFNRIKDAAEQDRRSVTSYVLKCVSDALGQVHTNPPVPVYKEPEERVLPEKPVQRPKEGWYAYCNRVKAWKEENNLI